MAEKISVKCEECGKRFKAPGKLAGQKARCPCGAVIEVPAPEQTEEESAPSTDDWYYVHEGERQGPVALEELVEKLRQGELGSQDRVWTKGMSDWLPAEDVDQLPEVSGASETGEEPEEGEKGEGPEEPEEKAVAAEKAEPEKSADEVETEKGEEEPATEVSETQPAEKSESKPEEGVLERETARPAKPAQTRAKSASEGTEPPELRFARIMAYACIALGSLGLIGSLALAIIGLVRGHVDKLKIEVCALAGAGVVLLVWGGFLVVGRSLTRAVWSVDQQLGAMSETDGSSR